MLSDEYTIDEKAAYVLEAASVHIESNHRGILDAIEYAAESIIGGTLVSRFPVYACAVERAFDILPEAYYGDGKSMVKMEGALMTYDSCPADSLIVADLLRRAAEPTIHRLPERPKAAA